jgi:hypothetical protein
MNVPDAPPPPLPGRSAFFWAKRTVICIVVAVPTVC